MKYILTVLTLFILLIPTQAQARTDINNILEDIKIFRYYEEGTNNILKKPLVSVAKFTKAIDLLKKKPVRYWFTSPYKSFTYRQLFVTILFWRACAALSIKGYGKNSHYVATDDLLLIVDLNGIKYLKSLGIDVWKTIKAMKGVLP